MGRKKEIEFLLTMSEREIRFRDETIIVFNEQMSLAAWKELLQSSHLRISHDFSQNFFWRDIYRVFLCASCRF